MCPDVGRLNYTVSEKEYYHVMVANFHSFTEREFDINLTFEQCQYHSTSQNPQPYCVITPYQWCEILLSFGYNMEFLITTSAPSDSSCRRELQKVVIQYRYRRELLFVYFIILFSLITLLYAYPQFRNCTCASYSYCNWFTRVHRDWYFILFNLMCTI